MKEIIINYDGDINAFKEAFNEVQVVTIPEMVDNTYLVIFRNDFIDEEAFLEANGKLEIVGKWDEKDGKQLDKDKAKIKFTKTKYSKYLRDVWNEEEQKFEKAKDDMPVNIISGWKVRDIVEEL